MMKYVFLILVFGLTINSQAQSNSDTATQSPSVATKTLSPVISIQQYCISGTQFVTLSDQHEDQTMIRLYNMDGTTLWHEFNFVSYDSDGRFEYENEAFSPFNFDPYSGDFALEIVSTTEDYYVVKVNYETDLQKVVYKAAYFATANLPELYEITGWIETNKALPAIDAVTGTLLTAHAGPYVIMAIEGDQICARIDDEEFVGPLNDMWLPICFEGEIVLFTLR